MKIQGVGRADAGGSGADGVQWLLQPRGTARLGGPKHFQHSVRHGIELSDPKYAEVLGGNAAALNEAFPDGVARFWGAITPKKANGVKGVALRECRVGDEVLFYGEKKFIARATILLKFHNPALAERVWGTTGEGAVWEHMIALGDVVEFTTDAMPLLAAIDGPDDKLWGLKLLSAQDRTRLFDLVAPPSVPGAGGLPAPRKPATASPSVLEQKALLHAFSALRTHTSPDGPSPHKPLALLWSIGRLEAGEDRLAPWDVFEREVGALLAEFGGAGSQVTPHYPFSRLRGAIWEVEGFADGLKDPGPATLRKVGAKAGFVADAARLLRKASVRAKAVRQLSSTYFEPTDLPRVLERVGLAGYLSASGHSEEMLDERADTTGGDAGPVKRRAVNGTRPDRNQEFVDQVKGWHQHVCQVCSESLEVLFGHYSEAAHIQGVGSPHHGPDRLSNMLCLCPNHHKQFDRLAIYIDPEWNVRRTRDDAFLYELRRDDRHEIDPVRVEYHRVLCGKDD
ncbi:HNH endonuclease [Streptomyces sp. NPDC056501]|uniref:HNH endonuclease n=1 Tax=Streptomyces sp. NPDC056501 TaxID=3345841 RepID=UPI00368F781C